LAARWASKLVARRSVSSVRNGIVRENAAGDVLASLTTMLWNAPSKSWAGRTTMADPALGW